MKKIKTLSVLSILVSILFASSISTAMSQPYVGDTDGTVCEGVAPIGGSYLRVLVCYDEEFEASYFDFFDFSVDPKTYMKWQLQRAFYRFPYIFQFQIAGYEQWISDNPVNLEYALVELEQDMGWQKGGMWYKSKWVSLLVGWTTQYDPERQGCAHVGYGACIISQDIDWTDDNTIAEEVAHLFGDALKEHCFSTHCMMSRNIEYYYYFDEPLMPILDEVKTIWIWANQYVGSVNNEWCDFHWEGLLDSGAVVYWNWTEQGYFHSDPRRLPTKPRRLPTHPETPYLIVLGVALIVIAILVYRHRKKIRKLL